MLKTKNAIKTVRQLMFFFPSHFLFIYTLKMFHLDLVYFYLSLFYFCLFCLHYLHICIFICVSASIDLLVGS